MSQRFDEGPLAVHGAVQELGVEATSPLDGAAPEAVDDVPCFPEAGGVGGTHLGPVGMTMIELGLDQGCYIDAVHHDILEITFDADVAQLDPAHNHVVEVDGSELGA